MQTTPEIGETVELSVTSIGFGGLGVARHPSGVVCLVPKTLPGEKLLGRVVRKKKRHLIVSPLEFVHTAPERRKPVCDVFERCGGCQLQQLNYEDQLKLKQTLLQDRLQNSKVRRKPKLHSVEAAVPDFGYRNRNFFHVADGEIGFVDPHERRLIPIEACPCAPETTNQLLSIFNDWFLEIKSDLGRHLLDVMIRESVRVEQRMLILVFDKQLENELTGDIATHTLGAHPLRALVERLEGSSIYLNFKCREQKESFGENFIHLAGSEKICERIGDINLMLSPASFSQIHADQADRLYTKTLALLDIQKREQVLDLYSGSGALAFYLAKRAHQVHAVELNRQAVLDAKDSKEVNELTNVHLSTGKCETMVEKLYRKQMRFPVATLNPPRRGCHPDVLRGLSKLGIDRFAYISCSPPTLMRDMVILEELGYEALEMFPFDMFAQTYHLEVLTLFKKT